jgi:tellurite resistance protein
VRFLELQLFISSALMRRLTELSEIAHRAIVDAIAANEDIALTSFYVHQLELNRYCSLLGLSDEFSEADNDDILAELQKVRLTRKVKSARGGTG